MNHPIGLRALSAILTSDCNLRCAYCYQSRSNPQAMGWRTLRAALDVLLASPRPSVKLHFTGGEPLLAFPLLVRGVEYVEARKRAGMEVEFQITTNGSLIRAREMQFLAEHDFDVQVSFDGVEPAQRLRGSQTFASLDRLLDRWRRDHASHYFRRFSTATTAVAENLPFLADSVEFLLGKGVPTILVGPALTHQANWRPGPDAVGALDAQFSRVFETSRQHYRRTGEVPLALFRRARGARFPTPGSWLCGAGGGESLAIDVDGEVSGCVLFAPSYARYPPTRLGRAMAATRLGPIGDRGLPGRLARYSVALAALGIFHHRQRKRSSLARCATCTYRRECHVCPICIVHQPGGGDADRIPDFVCAFARTAAKYRRRFPATPDTAALLRGGAPQPALVRELVEFVNQRSAPDVRATDGPRASRAGP